MNHDTFDDHALGPNDRPHLDGEPGEPDAPEPLLIDIRALSALLDRSVASLERDAAAGRLPRSIRLGSSRKWRVSEVRAWVDAGCPPLAEWKHRSAS